MVALVTPQIPGKLQKFGNFLPGHWQTLLFSLYSWNFVENNSVLTKNQPTDNQNCLFTTFFNVNFQDVFLRIFFQLLLKILRSLVIFVAVVKKSLDQVWGSCLIKRLLQTCLSLLNFCCFHNERKLGASPWKTLNLVITNQYKP